MQHRKSSTAVVETIKAEVGKLNGESKEQREAKEKAEALVKTLTKQRKR
ncbi:MAG: hypothetical protein KHX78_05695 [Megasphaera micronuciformis]|nr:hypothetical protein [Megasphaera micronuciformis]